VTVALVWAVTQTPAPASADCTPGWTPNFSRSSRGPTLVNDAALFDDGSGEHLYAAVEGGLVYMYDGTGWKTLGGKFYGNSSGVASGYVYALHVHDPDGTGPEPASLYASGIFRRVGSLFEGTIVNAQNVARWNGTQWVAVGTSWAGFAAYALETFDDGSGPRLYLGGNGGSISLVRFNPGTGVWETPTPSPMFGTGVTVRSLRAFNDGSGPALFVGGDLSGAGGVSSPGIVKYTGSGWQAVGGGVNGVTYSMDVFDDGGGPALYAAGSYTSPTPDRVMKWDGAALSGTGSNIYSTAVGPYLETLTVGGEKHLYASGQFFSVGDGVAVHSVAKFDGVEWTGTAYAHDPNYSQFTKVAAVDLDGPGGDERTLVVLDATERPTKIVGETSVPLTASSPALIGSTAKCRMLDLDGAGPEPARMFAVGRFLKYADDGSVAIHHLGVFDGLGWSEYAGGLRGLEQAGDVSGENLNTCAVFDDGAGPQLYVAGVFSHNDGVQVNSILKYDGANWSAVGGGVTNAGNPGTVNDMVVFDDGFGPALYVAGGFDMAGSTAVSNIAKWNGTAWEPLGAGVDGGVMALYVFNGPGGAALYAGGSFTSPGSRIAKWNGSAWETLAGGVGGTVNAMTTCDLGDGPKLAVTGAFTTADGASASRVALWDGTAWSPLGAGLGNVSGVTFTVSGRSLTMHDDGSGPALYVGGSFTAAGGSTNRAYGVARWDGQSWSALDRGLMQPGEASATIINALVSMPVGNNPALYVAGTFGMAGASRVPSVSFAKWACAPTVCAGDCDCDGDVDFFDIDPFVNKLGCPGAGPACDEGCSWQSADVDDDGDVDFFDIDPFVASLGTVCP
jgi:hypothetical protein